MKTALKLISVSYYNISISVPSSAPQSFTGSSPSPTSVVFTWSPPPAGDQNGVIISYQLNVTLLAAGVVYQYVSTTTSITISGLQPFTTYSCVVAAETAVGLGPFTTVFSITTPEDGEYMIVFNVHHNYTHDLIYYVQRQAQHQ